ncbi:MAG: hypothetical protein ACO4AI_11760 [Prochlorothrix sp.]|nr:hypothetical protein [Prochlorothrix sp.]
MGQALDQALDQSLTAECPPSLRQSAIEPHVIDLENPHHGVSASPQISSIPASSIPASSS